MPRKSAGDSYVETAILTASQEELVVKLYDGLIQFTRLAMEKMESDPTDIEFIHNQLRKSQRALAILMSSLNFELGGEIAANLFQIYEKWHHELVMANMRQERWRLEALIPVFKEYRLAWSEVIDKQNASLGRTKPATEAEATV